MALYRTKAASVEAVRIIEVRTADGLDMDNARPHDGCFSEVPGWLRAAVDGGEVGVYNPGYGDPRFLAARTNRGVLPLRAGDLLVRGAGGVRGMAREEFAEIYEEA